MEPLHAPPSPHSLTPLATHHARTPTSFHAAPPILHHHTRTTTLALQRSDLAACAPLARLFGPVADSMAVNGNGDGDGDGEGEFENGEVEVWVTSERFILFSHTLSTGLSIPYPSISLHALQPPSRHRPASLFLQLQAQTFDDHDPDSTVSVTIIPAAATTGAEEEPEGAEASSEAERLYEALSACASLHPDAASGSEGEGDGVFALGGGGEGLPAPVPGSGGWITAENVGEFFDEGGNWRGDEGDGEGREVDGGGLGGGAGSVRTREGEVDGEDVDGEGEGVGETKWRRMD